jgi:adenosylcobinamide kinase / adenosylcobinamide-phosphate guanylyltransferase
MAVDERIASELILGGQRSGKSRLAEQRTAQWLALTPAHRAVFVATGQPWDEEMRQRIARHQSDRAVRLPSMRTVEEPLQLAQAIGTHSRADTLVVVDCLTLWLTNWLMPAAPDAGRHAAGDAPVGALLMALRSAPGPVVLVSNEIGLGVIPMQAEVRAFVDVLGRLNQDVAQACARVTLMAAGLPLALKGIA